MILKMNHINSKREVILVRFVASVIFKESGGGEYARNLLHRQGEVTHLCKGE